MHQIRQILTGIAVAIVLAACAMPAMAQTVTTGTLTGVVMDAQKAVLPGATVTALHVPTGSTYEAVTQADGRFTMLAVRVGGPYTVTAAMSGFKPQAQASIVVALGESRAIDFTLPLEAMQETVNVVAQAQVIDTTRAGTADSVTKETLNALPTVARSLADFARSSPHFNATASNDGDTIISVAGQNNRYNNIQIDGAVNNDLFGLAANGAPGGGAGTQPISLDAVAELQLVVSPYDVRQGGFAGGGVNAITKSGSNAFSGSGYYYFRNQDWVGKGPADRAIATFSDKQYGASLGGPIATNKAFFFTNVDYGRRSTPTGYSADGSSGQNFGRTAEVQQVYDILKSVYKYDPAPGANPLQEFIRDIRNNKFFVRTDFNLSNRHRLTARYNYIDANQWVGSSSTTSYKLWDNYYNNNSGASSFVGQLNSTFGQSFNEFRVTYQRIRDHREVPEALFPQVTVRLSDGVGRVVAGAEQFSVANALDQDIYEFTDDFTMVKGTHTFTVGTHNEFFKFRNVFIRDNAGTYEFSSPANLAAGIAGGFDYSFSTTADPKQAARFRIRQWGFYVGDQWRVKPRFTLTYGFRWDGPNFPDTPTANPAAQQAFGYGTDVVPSPSSWSPRAGFNYELPGQARQQIRGGVGLFSGRTPYVWLSNQYGNTGIEFRRLRVNYSASNNVTFVPDPNKQPTTIGSAATNEIDVVDPDYKFPQLIRGNLGYDRQLPWGMRGTFEYLFSTVVKDIKYQNLNMLQAGTRPDGRPFYGRVNTTYSDVIFLTNTKDGNSSSVSLKLDKPWKNGWFASGSYIYGRANSIMDGTSSQAASNWGNVYVPGDMNNPPLAVSNFDVRHRVTMQASYDFPIYKAFKATASVYYNGQSGRPYADLFSGDVNGDGRTTNDLLYVPRDANDVVVYNGTYDTLDMYLKASGLDAYRGQIISRNIFRSPWVNGMDVKFNFKVPTGKRIKTEVTFDILNFINMFDRNSGTVQYATFNDLLPLGYGGLDTATGKMRYNVQNLTNLVTAGRPVSPESLYTTDDLRSRWQAQLGLRLRF